MHHPRYNFNFHFCTDDLRSLRPAIQSLLSDFRLSDLQLILNDPNMCKMKLKANNRGAALKDEQKNKLFE